MRNQHTQKPFLISLFACLLLLNSFKSFAQPANDLCANAISITSSTSCINTAGTLVSSTYTPPLAGCGATNKNDVWYKFVAQASTETITFTSGFSQPRIQLFSGSCGSLVSVACGNASLVASGLTVSNTYYIRIYTQDNSSGAFNLCVVHTGPANDDCAGAISLTSNTSCVNTAGTLNLATSTAGVPVGCAPVGTHYDVWYSFVAATTTETITISGLGGNITNPRIQLFSGTCGALSSLSCGTTTITNSSLTIGTTYYVRVANLTTNPSGSGSLANFSICVTHTGPANDDCANAILLTSNLACSNTGGTLVGATYATISPIGCGVASRNDVWYKFVAAASNATITLSSTPANPRIQLFSGTCGALSSLACGTSTLTYSSLTVGTTYYVRIYTDPNASGTFNICITHTRPANDDCAGAINLNSSTTCTNTAGSLNLATASAGIPLGCAAAGTYYDVWYSFVCVNTTQTVTISSVGANITNPRIQLFSGTCGALSSLTCGTTTLTNSALTVGTTYYVRVSNYNADPSGTGSLASFNICVTHTGLANDLCSSAWPITSASTCITTTGTTVGATYTTIPSLGCATSGIDAWYTFVAQTSNPTITGTSASSRLRLQLFSGSCGSLTSLACGTTSIVASGLTPGTTYYIRVYSSNGSTFSFDVCVTDPAMAATVDYSKSYVNITKQNTGGSVEPGDILEIRATFVVRTNSVDSVAFYDTLASNGGLSYVSGTLCTQTNEGKKYRGYFTEAYDADEGTVAQISNTSDTAIQINMGLNASGTARGKLRNTSRPSFYTTTCIIMATYRVQVYADYGTKINWGGGAITYRDTATGRFQTINFKNDSLAVYISPGLCSNALSSINKVGVESNGTFDTPATGAPLARNRGTSTAVPGYTYDVFKVGNGPQDYYYGIANNTSATFSITNALPKSGTVAQRVFSLWDIIGDHTGASNTSRGNNPCDTTKPISATNPCGYMLVVNSAYKTDTAFRTTISSLCPNTYYEISAWIRNICYKCGCDSAGRGASTAGYIPFGTNDSSGVRPNLAFQVNGQDYYSTGDISYTGTGAGITQQASDSVNTWVKRGFVYKTEVGQTSFELLIRNNAPGGGGNDWALDDITVSTCLPNMTYSPTVNPSVCDSNTLTINDTVRCSYENYTYYKWQRSTNGGATWTDVTAVLGPATPFWNGTAWEYVASYTIPISATNITNNGDLYRMIVATTASNLSDVNCQFTDVINIVTVNVINCLIPLNTFLLSFNGKLANDHASLHWSTAKETEPMRYEVERSNDGIHFFKIGTVNGLDNFNSENNHYYFTDPVEVNGRAWYRIGVVFTHSGKKYSWVIQLENSQDFELLNVVNPFKDDVQFNIQTPKDAVVNISLVDMVGKPVRQKTYSIYAGVNAMVLPNTGNLPSGVYILQVKQNGIILGRKLFKK
jgi:hypothetical protein